MNDLDHAAWEKAKTAYRVTMGSLYSTHDECLADAIRAYEAHKASAAVKRPATVEELDALLNSEGDEPITILPDGTIAHKASAVPEDRPSSGGGGSFGPTQLPIVFTVDYPSAVPEEIAEVVRLMRDQGCCVGRQCDRETGKWDAEPDYSCLMKRAADLLERQYEWSRKQAADIITLGGEIGRLEQELKTSWEDPYNRG